MPRYVADSRDGCVEEQRAVMVTAPAASSLPRLKLSPRRQRPVVNDGSGPTSIGTSFDAKWRAAYAIRRCVWHVVDHAREIEDKGMK